MNLNEYTSGVYNLLKKIKEEEVEKLIRAIEVAYKDDRAVFIFGNGGSGANASHICEDLGKGILSDLNTQKRLKVISLTDNTPYILAWANDNGYDSIFMEQLKNLARPDDLAIGISGSGNSQNVVRAIEYANNNSINSFGLTGFSGGTLKTIAQNVLHIDSYDMGAVECLHLLVFHYVIDALREKYKLAGTAK